MDRRRSAGTPIPISTPPVRDGRSLGYRDRDRDGEAVGSFDGETVGSFDGETVGSFDVDRPVPGGG